MTKETDFINAVIAALAIYNAPAAAPAQPTLALIGDSRLLGDYNLMLGRTDIINLAIAGTKASEWLANWQANLNLIPASVTKVIVQYGKNEIDAGISSYDNAHGIQDVATIIQTHRNIKVGVLGTLPVATFATNYTYTNIEVAALLPIIASQMASASPVVKYLEGYQTLVSGGVLQSQYTDDGSHLNSVGKAIYKNSITALEAML